MNLSKKAKMFLAIFAACILLLCIVWAFTRGRTSERSRICAELARFGYEALEDDLLFAYDERDTSIKNALDVSDDELLDGLVSKIEDFLGNALGIVLAPAVVGFVISMFNPTFAIMIYPALALILAPIIAIFSDLFF